jgi:hypothetical protein
LGLSETAGSPKYLHGIGAPAFFCRKNGTGLRTRQKETAMSGFDKNTIGSFLIRLIPIAALLLFMTPSAADAKPRMLLYDAEGRLIAPETSRQKVMRKVLVCLNESGDLVLRSRDVSLTIGDKLDYPSRKNVTR